MKIEVLKIDEITPYENNAKLHPKEQIEQIKNSILEFGNNDPIAIDKNNVIIEGHGRFLALQELGYEEVEVIRLDHLTEQQRKAYTLIHNKLTMNSDFDLDILKAELESIDEFNMEDYDFDIELDDLQETEETQSQAKEDDYEVKVPKKTKTKYGDVYQLGRHRLMCGDSTKSEDVSKLMGGEIAHISFTSPPYNVGHNLGYENKDSKYINNNDAKNEDDYVTFLKKFTQNAINFSQYTFVNIQSLANNKISLIKYLYEMQNNYADTMIWDKGFGVPNFAHNVLNSSFEYIHIFNHNGKKTVGTKYFHGTLPNIFSMSGQSRNEYSEIHNATFSIEFVSYFINNFTNENEKILDLFGGTGTSLIACEQLNRNCFMMEFEPQYVDVIIDRWETFTGEKAILL